ncbi:hypothetical protein DM01DRAFT_1316969 [Hesseltinella vesiculosa]|uniref:Uncharacterized protein n=1 Tax=Hesseltinella vesiculosa TaxID=101127 RepID=A0A1X2GSH3_9FUNG|nr:hypothetical protein DM01DRAFT_1316969 [Hesseltinella vesiculosa]
MTSTFATNQYPLIPFREFSLSPKPGFEKQCAFHVDPQETIQVTKYKSSITGLTVLHIDVESPLVSGFLTLATEAFDNDGYPHTLEHLAFMGSQTYPYKGVLDSLAIRAFARGTNAWTDVDHTCYSVMTAGADGFLRFLPVYVDHILYPTLTESGFHTEIHHIGGDGEDAGMKLFPFVVYCEMKSRQNGLQERLVNRTKELLFPSDCHYRHVVGGKSECIRHITLEKVRNYHAQFYRPDNLCIIISGKVDPAQLMQTLDTIDRHIDSHGPKQPSPRPWSSVKTIPDLPATQSETVYFPDTDESVGDINITWLGPAWNDTVGVAAIQALHIYLTNSPVAPLQRLLVETQQPICTDIDMHITKLRRILITASLENVAMDQADRAEPLIFQHLKDLIHNRDFDMSRMKMIIERERLKLLDDFENYPLFCISVPSITDFIYGDPDGHDLPATLQKLKPLDELLHLTKDDWLHLLQTVYIDRHHVALIGRPSSAMAKELHQKEEARLAQQKEHLGPAKLNELARQLEAANQQNEQAIPSQLLTSFAIPDVSSIATIDVMSAQCFPLPSPSPLTNTLQTRLDAEQTDVPCFIQFDHVRSPFVTLSVYLNTGDMPSHLRSLGRLYMDSFFSLPTTTLTSDDLVNKLTQDTIDYSIRQGRGMAFREYIVVTLKVKTDKYASAVAWLHDLLWASIFTADKMKITCSKILNDLPQEKRNGRSLAGEINKAVHFDHLTSTDAACGLINQGQTLPKILEQLNTDPSTVLASMNSYRQTLCSRQNIQVHVIGNILDIQMPKSPFKSWESQIPGDSQLDSIPNVTLAKDVLSRHGQRIGSMAVLVNQPTMETSCSIHTVAGPSRFDSPDIPALIILIEILRMTEGVFWRMVRGKGLAYDCYLVENIEAGLISLWILQSSDVVKAFEQIKNVMNLYAQGKLSFDHPTLEGAKSTVIYDLAQSEITRSSAATHRFMNLVLKPSQPEKSVFLQSIQAVTLDDIQRVLHTYLLALFDPHQCNHVIVSCPTKCQSILKSFQSMDIHHLRQVSPEDVLT